MSLVLFPYLFFFFKILRRIDTNATLNAWQNSSLKPFGSGLFFVGMLLIIDSISLLGIGIFQIFSFFMIQSLQEVYFQSIFFYFFQAIQFVGVYLFIVVFVILRISVLSTCNVLSLITGFIYLSLLSFFLIQLSVNFVNISNNQLTSGGIFYCFLTFISFFF